MNYADSLDRALDALPERNEEQSRLNIPDPAGETDGAFTRLTNIGEIADALGRDVEHVHRNVQGELGTNGQLDENRARYNGSFTVADFEAAIDEYVAEYVTCTECGLPDTRLVTEDGVDMLRCEACGAFRPVTKRSTKNTQTDRPTLEEGKTYEVKITGTGREGDGVAEKGKYTIFVPGAEEGDVVDAYIENLSGTLAFAKLA
jgi:translation initiation factor 2 subunit 2